MKHMRKIGKRSGVLLRVRQRENRPPLGGFANSGTLITAIILCFSEIWLSDKIPPMAIQLDGFSILRADRSLDSGKSRGGGDVVSLTTDGVQILHS